MADDIFSDTMELTNYLHRRAQEVSNKFRYRLLTSIIDETPTLSLGFCHHSNPRSQPAVPNSGIIAFRDTGNHVTEGNILEEILQEKHAFPETYLPCLNSMCEGMAMVPEIGSTIEVEAHCITNEAEQSRTFDKLTLPCKEMEGLPNSCSTTPSYKSFEDPPGTLCPRAHHIEKLPLSLELPSLQDHATMDAEDEVAMQQDVAVHEPPPASEDIMFHEVASEKLTDSGFFRSKESSVVDLALQDVKLPSPVVGAEMSSVHSLLRCSLSSVDSSECDNCKLDAVSEHAVTDMEEKPKELDARNEARCLKTDHKAEIHEEGEMLATGGREATRRGIMETKTEAWGFLLDAINVTAEEGLVQGARPCPSQDENEDDRFLGERKEALTPAKVFHRANRGQPHLLGKGNGIAHPSSSSCQDMASDIVELPSTLVSLHVQNCASSRKRIHGRPKTHVKAISSLNSVVRFKSLHDVSEMEEKRARVSSEREEHVSNQEKRAHLLTCPEQWKGRDHTTGKARDMKDEEQERPRRTRSQVLPNKFSDSVLQPWKKREREEKCKGLIWET